MKRKGGNNSLYINEKEAHEYCVCERERKKYLAYLETGAIKAQGICSICCIIFYRNTIMHHHRFI